MYNIITEFESKKIVYQFLEELESGKTTTQKELSKRLRVSIGFVNSLIKKFIKKGLIKAKQAPYKRFIYYLTPEGFIEKGKLVSDYLNSSLVIFKTLRKEFSVLFENQKKLNERCSFVLFGVTEVTEICIISALQYNVKIAYVVDKKYKKLNFLGINVKKQISKLKDYEKIIITNSLNTQDLYHELSKIYEKEKILVVPSLSVSKTKPIYNPG